MNFDRFYAVKLSVIGRYLPGARGRSDSQAAYRPGSAGHRSGADSHGSPVQEADPDQDGDPEGEAGDAQGVRGAQEVEAPGGCRISPGS